MKRLATILAFAALAASAPLRLGAQTAEVSAEDRLAAFELSVSTGDPAAATAFLADDEVLALLDSDPSKAARLRARATAVKDLNNLLKMEWTDATANQLSEALAQRIDVNKPLSAVGVGPEPEKLLAWLSRFKPTYPADKKAAVRKAIRQWEIVFGTVTATHNMSWDQATSGSGRGVTLTKADWEGWTVRERNAIIGKIVARNRMFMLYDDRVRDGMVEKMGLQAAVDSVRTSGVLTPAQVAALSGKPLADQLYLLGSYFDGGAASGVSADLRMRIDAARASLPAEVLNTSQREVLGTMLNTSVAAELSGTRAGDRVMAYHAANGGLRVRVAPLTEGHSSYDAATGTVILDSETIQQYMRMRGYTASSVMSDPAQLAEIAKYMSPAVVYESSHLMQAAWARNAGVYHPHTQEGEIEAMSLEGLYSTEKLGRDAEYKRILTESRAYSPYATKRVDTATEFGSSGAKMFATTVRQRYFSGLPSLDAAASQVLAAVTGELERRESLSETDRAAIDSTGLTLAEAMEMSPAELCGSVGEVRSSALAELQDDLTDLGVYRSRYSSSERGVRRDLRALTEAPTAPAPSKTAVPPAL